MTLPLALILPFVAAPFIPILHRYMGRRVGLAVAVVPAVLVVYFLTFLGQVGAEGVAFSRPWIPLLDVNFSLALNGFSLLFALLITGIGTLVVLYAVQYFGAREDLGKFFAYIMLFMGAMLGVVMSDNLILFYMFWELTSVSSFLLIGFWHTSEDSRYGALKALLLTVFGGFAILAGVVLLYTYTGTFEFSEMLGQREALRFSGIYLPAAILLLLGALTKSAQVPFHIWLPGAMAAPTPVSAYLHSATMVKAGIFLVAKFSLLLGGTPFWYYTIAAFGAVTVLTGAALAIRQFDLKALLAFSTVSQLGLIMPMFALGTQDGALAGSAHILNHATFKGALFMLVGIIDHQTGTRDLRRLSGLRKTMPITSVLIAIAALSMAGVWPLNGFVSKEHIFLAMLDLPFGTNFWTWTFAALAVAGSMLTTVYCLILAHRITFGEPSKDLDVQPQDPPFAMLFGPVILAIFVVVLGIVPHVFEPSLYLAAAAAAHGGPVQVHLHNVPELGGPLYMSLIALSVGFLGYLGLDSLRKGIERLAPRIHANTVYELFLVAVDRVPNAFLRLHMTGFLRDYIVYIMAAATVLVGTPILTRGVLADLRLDFAPITFLEIAVCGMIVVTSLMVVFARRRLPAMIAMGTSGTLVAFLYVLLRAPDLALTQLMVEAVSAVLILLAFARLPAFGKEVVRSTHKTVNVLIAVGSGLLVTVLALIGNGGRLFPSISSYFVENSVLLGGGRNIVNVVLVDFRGFDTMGEITVLGIAGLSIFALIRLRRGAYGSKGGSESTRGSDEYLGEPLGRGEEVAGGGDVE